MFPCALLRRIGQALITGALALGLAPPCMPQSPAPSISLQRTYKPGEMLRYRMKGSNAGWEYQVDATSVVKRDSAGAFYEELGWSQLQSNAPMTLSPESLGFRQELSLDGTGKHIAIPDLSKVQPQLIGPITDMLTFYADVLAAKQQKLGRMGAHAYFEHGTPNSWADGQRVILGQDSIDFDLTLLEADPGRHTATLLVRHVPPHRPQIQLPAEWMRPPVAGEPNNWVQVTHADGKYLAQVGKETFEVHIVLDTTDGKIRSARLVNPLTILTRQCDDPELRQCGPPQVKDSRREVSLELLPSAPDAP